MAHTNGTTGTVHPECCLLDSDRVSTTTGVTDGEKFLKTMESTLLGGGVRPWWSLVSDILLRPPHHEYLHFL